MAFFGLEIPSPFASYSKPTHRQAMELHEKVGWAIVIVAVLHALAALYHHYRLRDRVLVERIEEQEQRIGGIIVPDTAKEKPQQGRVVAVGKGRVNDKGEVFPLDVKAGDTVLFGKYGGTEVKIDGKEYLILREDEILGVTDGVPEAALA